MKVNFWDSLIRGLTPEKPADLAVYWQVPLVIAGVIFFLAVF